MRHKIIKIFQEQKKALSVEDIRLKLGLEKEKESLIVEELKSLENELKIRGTKKKKYCIEQNDYKTGIYHSSKKDYGFVTIEDSDIDIYIPSKYTNGAIEKDKVVIQKISSDKGQSGTGQIIKVVEHAKDTFVGEVIKVDDKTIVVPDNRNVNINIIIAEDEELVEGHKVLVKLLNQIDSRLFSGEVERVLGHKDDPGVDIESIINEHSIRYVFSEEIERELINIPSNVSKKELKGREDLRNELIYSIDDISTKDRDDAISISKRPNGNYLLGVHISDVSYYVREGSAIDEEAKLRGNSVYLINTSVPMLPRKLSNGICSLNQDVDRLTKTCEMEINNNGEVVGYDIFDSVIKSSKEMTYQDVNKILDENECPIAYSPFVENLVLAKELADILRNRKIRRGYQDFDLAEAKILVDELGKPIEIKERERGSGEKLIEDFMIVANETVAEYQENLGCPTTYRVHPEPNPERFENFLKTINALGHKINVKADPIFPTTVQKILNSIKEEPDEEIIKELALRSMAKAKYSPENEGHFGLASKCYCHFTSPIRRYSDLTVHRSIDKIKSGKIYTDESYFSNLKEQVREISVICSTTEREADECEREAEKMKKAEYMKQYIGETFEGIINGISSKGMFIKLPNTVEGFVKSNSFYNDNFIYDPKTMTLVGRTSKKKYHFGDKAIVLVKDANKELRTVDFVIPNKNDPYQKKLINPNTKTN